MLATQYSSALEMGVKFSISNRPRRGEKSFVSRSLGWKSWFPWIWIRHLDLGPSSLGDSWKVYFDSNFDFVRGAKKLKCINRKYLPMEYLAAKFVIYTHALSKLFILSNYSKDYIDSVIDAELFESSYIALHIRRGENVSHDGSWIRPGFTYVSLDEYLSAIENLSNLLNTRRIFLSCDSNSDFEIINSKLCTEYQVFSSRIDRARFYRPKPGQIEDVETWCQKNTDEIPFYALSGIADLFAMSKSVGMVGNIGSSEFAKTAWLLACANHKRFIPFKSLGSDLDLGDPTLLDLH